MWRNREALERLAARRFRRLAKGLAAHAAGPRFVELAHQASEDEQQHALLCARTAAQLRESVPDLETRPASIATVREETVAIAPARLEPAQRLLYEIVAIACVGETCNTAYLVEGFRGATEPVTRRATQELLRDEVEHSRLGWALLAVEAKKRSLAFLSHELPIILAASVSPELFEPEPEEDRTRYRAALATLPRARRLRVLTTALEEIVLPGLAALSIDPSPAHNWLRDRRAGGRC